MWISSLPKVCSRRICQSIRHRSTRDMMCLSHYLLAGLCSGTALSLHSSLKQSHRQSQTSPHGKGQPPSLTTTSQLPRCIPLQQFSRQERTSGTPESMSTGSPGLNCTMPKLDSNKAHTLNHRHGSSSMPRQVEAEVPSTSTSRSRRPPAWTRTFGQKEQINMKDGGDQPPQR